jgi:tetratricopeptide (TPR) repeat protein
LAEASAAFGRRDFETASAKFRSAYEASPSFAPARVGYAISEMALGRNERALPVVLEGLSRSPESADLHEVLGDLRDSEEQVDDALRSWQEAFRLAPNDRLRGKIFKAERELHAGRDYSFSAAAHFNLRYDGSLDPKLAADVEEHLESSYRDLASLFRYAPPQPITVLLYPERQFRDVTQAPDSVGGLFDGKIRVPLGGIRSIDDRARRVLVHELAHAFLHAKTRGNCPRWLHEGLAQRAEGKTVGPADQQALRRLFRDHEPAEWDRAAFSYPAALSLTLYLESRRGFSAVVDVLDRLEDGADLDTALKDLYGESYAEICRRWAEQVRGESRP